MYRRRKNYPYGSEYADERTPHMPVLVGGIVALVAVLALAVIATVSTCAAPKKDTLTVGTNTPFPPFETRNGEELSGFDIDLAQKIAEELKRKLIIKDFSEFDALLPALQAEKLDMVISALTIREDRDEVVDFSDSYFAASQGVLALKGTSFSYAGSPEAFTGKIVGYQEGTTSENWIEEHISGKVAVRELIPFGDITVGLQFLRMKSVDLIIMDEPAVRSFARSNPDLAAAGVIETGERYGVAVREKDPQRLLPTVNEILRRMRENGEYERLLEKWFGEKP